MEMGIATAYCSGASPDFNTGVSAVLLKKTPGRPAWSPETIEDVTPEILDRFFWNKSPYRSQMPELSLPGSLLDRSDNFMAFALPSESELVELIKSSCKDGPVSLSHLLAEMGSRINEKPGTKEKIIDVVYRKCQVTDDQRATIVAWKER